MPPSTTVELRTCTTTTRELLDEWFEDEGRSVKDFLKPKPGRAEKERRLPTITLTDLSAHNTATDMWIAIRGKVYNVTNFANVHPGGFLPLLNLAGKDCTDAFTQYHPASTWNLLPAFHVANLEAPPPSEYVSGHRAIRQQLLERGLYDTKPSYYVKKFLWIFSIFAASLYCTLGSRSFGVHMLGALLLGLFWQQLAFVGHDLGHNAVSHNLKIDHTIGLLCGNLLTGISIGWWKRSHNVHHLVCNSIEHDPDIQHLPFLAISSKIFDRLKFFSSYHNKWFTFDPLTRFLVSYQHFTYYPIMAVARFNLYVQSWLLMLSSYPVRDRGWEIVGLSLFATWNVLLLTTLNSFGQALCYLLLSHAFAGILHVQITLSHFAMEAYHGRTYTSDQDDWFRTQLKTSLNIKSNWLTDWFYGGLQFQVEHHLFPRLPRHNLREARKLVMAFCQKHKLEYRELGFIEANIEVIKILRRAAFDASSKDFKSSMLWEGLNARG
eukprot:TRINITY_DN1964_c0_g1_i1.p1 TRINITY_DN1964_c0_g1~~TRINITY_DN1964_c0_g1_i1.p1  ORF type:complete len:493 (-),score=111.32 TRINITY_DN1964_c0_g1_i1:417-1895(-)